MFGLTIYIFFFNQQFGFDYICIIMSRWMALDIGQKRTGIAITDESRIIATGLDTVGTHLLEEFLKTYLVQNKVSLIIVGFPRQMNHEISDAMKYITPQYNRLRKVFNDIPFEYYDERFTSKLAHDAMLQGGLKKKQRQEKSLVDKISAVLILQAYMEHSNFSQR